jgi:mycothiol synthase
MASKAAIRKFCWGDLEPFTLLFNEVNGVSGTEKAFDPELMRQLLSQPGRDPERHCYLAEVGAAPTLTLPRFAGEGTKIPTPVKRVGAAPTLAGFVHVVHEPAIGRALAGLGVLKSQRKRGIGRALISAAVEHSKALEASVLHIQVPSDDPYSHRLLKSEGFAPVRRYWRMRWQRGEVLRAKLPQGFSMRSFRLGQDEEALTKLQNAAFADTWGFCPNTVEEIRARVRFKRTEPEGIIFVLEGDRPAAYNWTLMASGAQAAIGWIAMTGVHPDFRGRGLGKAAVVAGMEYLVSRGVSAIELEVDSENAPARELYLSLGFQKLREMVWYERKLR